VEGTSCNECAEGTFYLSGEHELGCVRCFCMGHSRVCDSTTYNRAQVCVFFHHREWRVIQKNIGTGEGDVAEKPERGRPTKKGIPSTSE